MPSFSIVRNSPIIRTPRLMQCEGLFDISPLTKSEQTWQVDLNLPESWHVGLIVGPSGSGKTTIAREVFGDHLCGTWEWPAEKSILDGFPDAMSIKEIVALLSSVGFSSPPSWLRPFHVLSNGEQFRVNLARALAEMSDLAVVDEFSSVVDRTVAQIGSAAIAKTVRRRKQQFIAVSCHYDIIEWLEPDWIYQPHLNELTRGCQRRPPIKLEIKRTHYSVWRLFRKHHYLDTDLHRGAICFCAFWKGMPVAFSATLHMPHPRSRNLKREHRLVCLPDYQGVGIGNAVSAYIGSLWTALGWRYTSVTSNPAMIHARAKSRDWKMYSAPTMKGEIFPKGCLRKRHRQSIPTRLRASFEYVGKALDAQEARSVLAGVV